MSSRSQAQAEVKRLRDQIAQMQASTVEQIAQLRVEVAAREAEVTTREIEQSKKYDELLLHLQNMMKMFQQSQNLPLRHLFSYCKNIFNIVRIF
ncbi:Protein Noxp20 [Gossypium arboreum]|uniref:Protein Noxp20 n=1 Tax=Gossypium arboreum TaxID=29729 RepID=A0A0B0PDU3_GOSAR|nr:Protein Noxp20 [Gossypium arboreum]